MSTRVEQEGDEEEDEVDADEEEDSDSDRNRSGAGAEDEDESHSGPSTIASSINDSQNSKVSISSPSSPSPASSNIVPSTALPTTRPISVPALSPSTGVPSATEVSKEHHTTAAAEQLSPISDPEPPASTTSKIGSVFTVNSNSSSNSSDASRSNKSTKFDNSSISYFQRLKRRLSSSDEPAGSLVRATSATSHSRDKSGEGESETSRTSIISSLFGSGISTTTTGPKSRSVDSSQRDGRSDKAEESNTNEDQASSWAKFVRRVKDRDNTSGQRSDTYSRSTNTDTGSNPFQSKKKLWEIIDHLLDSRDQSEAIGRFASASKGNAITQGSRKKSWARSLGERFSRIGRNRPKKEKEKAQIAAEPSTADDSGSGTNLSLSSVA